MPLEYGFTRTNYFRVIDLDEIDFLMDGVIADDFEVLLRNHSICIRCAGEIQGKNESGAKRGYRIRGGRQHVYSSNL